MQKEGDEKRSCPAVSHGRVSDGRKESKRSGGDGDGPIFLESRIHLALNDAGASW